MKYWAVSKTGMSDVTHINACPYFTYICIGTDQHNEWLRVEKEMFDGLKSITNKVLASNRMWKYKVSLFEQVFLSVYLSVVMNLCRCMCLYVCMHVRMYVCMLIHCRVSLVKNSLKWKCKWTFHNVRKPLKIRYVSVQIFLAIANSNFFLVENLLPTAPCGQTNVQKSTLDAESRESQQIRLGYFLADCVTAGMRERTSQYFTLGEPRDGSTNLYPFWRCN